MTASKVISEGQAQKPIYALIDFAKNPVFLLSKERPEGFDGNFFVNGKIKTVVSGSDLLEDENDLFTATVHLLKRKNNFETAVLQFSGQEILTLMKWGTDGKSYKRLRDSARNLIEARVFSNDIFSDGSIGEGGTTLISDYYIVDRSKAKSPNSEVKSHITLSRLVVEKCQSGQLKALHPIYFTLKRSKEKRLFALISVRASDWLRWEVSIFQLRDLMPLNGKTYEEFGQVRAKIEEALRGLKEKGIIRRYELKKKFPLADSYFEIVPNPEYFYSQKRSSQFSPIGAADEEKLKLPIIEKSRQQTLAGPEKFEHSTVKKLIANGMKPNVAVKLVFKTEGGEAEANRQLDHLDFLIRNDRAPGSSAGFLLTAIKEKYVVPSGLKKDMEEASLQKAFLLIEEAKILIRSGSKEKIELAILKAEEANALGSRKRAQEQIENAKHSLMMLANPPPKEAPSLFRKYLEENPPSRVRT